VITAAVGLLYFLIGWLFALPATHVQAWRYAAWVVCAFVFVAQIGYERLSRGSAALALASRAGLASAIGGLGLAIAATIHDYMTRSAIRPGMFIALIVWPLITGIPAFVAAWVLGATLRTRSSRS
jgi:succinate dehydrogenase hydrophobic anchor subunit